MAKIFAYRGYIGIDGFNETFVTPEKPRDLTLADLSPALINDPTQPEQLGFIVDISKCQFTQEAVNLLQTVNKCRDAIGDVMCWNAGDKNLFGWMGGPLFAELPKGLKGDRDYNPKLLLSAPIVEFEIPKDFKSYVDILLEDETNQ